MSPQSAHSHTPAGGEILRSSTFRQAFTVSLLVWLLTASSLWTASQIERHENPEELRADIEVEVEEALSELRTIEREHADELADELADHDWRLEQNLEEHDDDTTFDPGAWSLKRLRPVLEDIEETRDWLWEEDYCWHLLGADGRWLDGSLSSTLASETAQELAAQDDDGLLSVTGAFVHLEALENLDLDEAREEWDALAAEDRSHCWMRELQLGDGSRLRIGREIEPREFQSALMSTLALLLLGLGAAAVGSYLLARRSVNFVSDLRRARARLEGEAFPRLRLPGDGGDFDRAATEINSILERLDNALGSLTHVTGNIAHDLRTPLTRLQGQLDILRRSDRPTEQMITAVQAEADYLASTFNALLRIAQVESGHKKRGFRSYDLRLVVADVAEFYAPAFAERDLAFEFRDPKNKLELYGDPDLWMQALSNLLDNALKYTPKGGHVDLELRQGPPPQLILRDSGPGIPTQERERVFERFYRSARNDGSLRGAGLGLSLVAAICNLHGVTIHLEGEDGLVVRMVWPA